uniref:Uncharacterized protein n=1 Tax=Oryza punctata TaxID=4537 RepID=A0A0E0KNR4_ORYPU
MSAAAKKRKTKTVAATATSVIHRQGHGTLASRPILPIHPPYSPTPYVRKNSRITWLEVARLKKLTLQRDKEDEPSTAAAFRIPSHKKHEGKLISPRTGIIIIWYGATKRAMTFTLSSYFKKTPHEPQLEVHLPDKDKSVVQGRFSFINLHYNHSILDIPLQIPLIWVSPKYGQECLVLGQKYVAGGEGGVGGPVVNTGGTTIAMIEDCLLSVGWRYLLGMKKSLVLKLEVHDIEGPCKETITLPLEFSIDSGKILPFKHRQMC